LAEGEIKSGVRGEFEMEWDSILEREKFEL
jgi:hypothetical protein